MNHYVVMFIIMIISGLLSTMNIWVDKIDDIRISINDIYMILLMTGWMFLFMGLFYKEYKVATFGGILVIFNLFAIRTQFLVSEAQYFTGMIPHHSMAVHISRKLLDKQNQSSNQNQAFVSNIIKTQEKEIMYMKNQLKANL